MPVPSFEGENVTAWGTMLNLYLSEVESRLSSVEIPGSPQPAFACTKANLPDALTYINCIAYVTDTKILVASDGTSWRRQDTGAVI